MAADRARYQRTVVLGATLAGIAWGTTGLVALLDPGPDPGPIGSLSFLLIEGGHAVAEAGMVVTLVGLWRSHRRRIGRLGNIAFASAATATALLAILTSLVVAGTAVGMRPDELEGGTVAAPLVALASSLFLFTLLGILTGYIGSGVTTIRAGVWPSLVGWLLIAHLFLLAANLVIYPIGIGIGVTWLALAFAARATAGPDVTAGRSERGR